MAYIKQNFKDGEILYAEQLNKMEEGIINATPIKGVDYWTEEDKQEILDLVLTTMGTSTIFGNVDENNIITLTSTLAEGKYSIKYELDDGTIIDIGDLTLKSDIYYNITYNLNNCTSSTMINQIKSGESYLTNISVDDGYSLSSIVVIMNNVDITSSSVHGLSINITDVTGDISITVITAMDGPAYINQIPISTDAEGNPLGIKSGVRLSLSSGNEKSENGYYCTGYIPAHNGDVISIKGIDLTDESATNIVGYDKNKQPYRSGTSSGNYGTTLAFLFITNGLQSNDIYTATLNDPISNAFGTDLAYIRIGSKNITDNSIITINQEIV